MKKIALFAAVAAGSLALAACGEKKADDAAPAADAMGGASADAMGGASADAMGGASEAASDAAGAATDAKM